METTKNNWIYNPRDRYMFDLPSITKDGDDGQTEVIIAYNRSASEPYLVAEFYTKGTRKGKLIWTDEFSEEEDAIASIHKGCRITIDEDDFYFFG